MKALMIIAPEDFRDEEFQIPYDFLKLRNIDIDIASTRKGLCKGKLGMSITASKDLSGIRVNDYDAIIFIGGPGTPIVRSDIRIAKEAFDQKKIIAAICWSPTILAKAGILKNRKATVWNGMDNEYKMLTSAYLEKQGAFYTGESATKDGNIITADGPGSAKQFGEMIYKALSD